jgi:small-conductance mechanosensitive channel
VDIARLSGDGVDMMLFAWAKTKDVGEAKNRITEAVRSQLLSNGMSLPLPQRDLHVYHHNADGTPLTEIVTRSVADGGDAVSAKPPA